MIWSCRLVTKFILGETWGLTTRLQQRGEDRAIGGNSVGEIDSFKYGQNRDLLSG